MKVEPKYQKKLQSVIVELTVEEAEQIYQFLIGRSNQPEHVYLLKNELYEALRD